MMQIMDDLNSRHFTKHVCHSDPNLNVMFKVIVVNTKYEGETIGQDHRSLYRQIDSDVNKTTADQLKMQIRKLALGLWVISLPICG